MRNNCTRNCSYKKKNWPRYATGYFICIYSYTVRVENLILHIFEFDSKQHKRSLIDWPRLTRLVYHRLPPIRVPLLRPRLPDWSLIIYLISSAVFILNYTSQFFFFISLDYFENRKEPFTLILHCCSLYIRIGLSLYYSCTIKVIRNQQLNW